MATAIELPTLGSLQDERHALRAQLARVRKRLRLQLALEFAVNAATVLTVTAAALVFLDWWFRFSLPVRVVMLLLGLGAALAFLGARAIRHWRASRLDELSLAMTLDRYRPGTGQQIADVLQLPDLLADPSASASSSPAMVRLAVHRACEGLAGSDWRALWNRRRTALHTQALIVGLFVPIAFGLFAPEAARLSVARWLLGSSERWPQQTYLTVMGLDPGGRILAPRDEQFDLDVRSDLPLVEPLGTGWLVRGRGEPFTLRHKPTSPKTPDSVQVSERTSDGVARSAVMAVTGPTQFRYEFPASSTSSTFRLSGGDDWLGPLLVDRVDRPTLAGIQLRVKEPGAAYNGYRRVDDPRQHLLFLPDTDVELTLIGSEALADARVKVHAQAPPGLKRVDERSFISQWVLHEATTLEIVLTSGKTGLASRPAFLSIGLIKDREPRVTLRAVGVGGHVTPVATIPLNLAATDDFGLAALRLQLDRPTAGEENTAPKTQHQSVAVPLPSDTDRAVLDYQVRHEVQLQADPPKVGTVLRFQGEAVDRCARGAQTGRSSALQLQVVSPEEFFYEILIRQRAERAKFVAVLETMEKQTPVLAGDPSHEDYLRVMRIQHAASQQLDQISGRIGDTLQEMKLNQIGSPKSHRLLQEAVIDPMRALTAGPINELRNVLQSAANASSSAHKEGARRLHNEVVTKMKAILDQMSQWESFVDVVNQVAEVIRTQQKVLQATEKARESRTQEVFDDKP